MKHWQDMVQVVTEKSLTDHVTPNPAALLHVMEPQSPTNVPESAPVPALDTYDFETQTPDGLSPSYRLGMAKGALISARARTTGILAMIDNLRRVQYMSHDEVLTMIEESVTELREALSRDIQD